MPYQVTERSAPVYASQLRREAARWRARVRQLEDELRRLGVDPAAISPPGPASRDPSSHT